jgi:hypothetical protein
VYKNIRASMTCCIRTIALILFTFILLMWTFG